MLPGKEYEPKDYMAMAWRWRWVIVASLAVGSYASLVVSSRLPDVYQSEMLIQVIPQRVPPSFVPSTISMSTLDRLSTLTEQILSRPQLQSQIEEMNLFPEERARLPMQDVVELMRRRIRVDPIIDRGAQDADSFYVRFEYADPLTARRVTERLGTLFIDANARDRGAVAQDTFDFLDISLNDARTKLEATEARLEQFKLRYNGRLPSQVATNEQSLRAAESRLQATLEAITRDRDDKAMEQRLYAEIEAQVVDVPTPQTAGGDSQAGSTADRLAAARDALTAMLTKLTPLHPDVSTTKGLIAKLEAQLEEEQARAEEMRRAAAENGEADALALAGLGTQERARQTRLRDTRSQIERLDRDMARREQEAANLRAQIEDLQRRIEQAPGLDSEYFRLTRDYETEKEAYDSLLAKANSAALSTKVEERQIGEQFKIIEAARTPVRPLGVDRLQLNVVGTLAGLGVGLLLAFLLELRDRSFWRPEDIVEVLKLPVIALVPRVLSDADRRRLRARRYAIVSGAVLAVVAGGVGVWALQLWRFVV
jgi:polysaccharide chain length determinant protein (PEP-CTERM system associated)